MFRGIHLRYNQKQNIEYMYAYVRDSTLCPFRVFIRKRNG
jgi:hypothetical protein